MAKFKIACLGDSLTYGYGIHPYDANEAWPALIEKETGFKTVNDGIPGMALLAGNGYWNSDAYLKAMRQNPDAVIFWLGENDSAEGIWNEAAFRNGYMLIVEELLEHVERDHLLLVTPIFPKSVIRKSVYDYGVRTEPLRKINEIIINAASYYGIEYLEPEQIFTRHDDLFSDDIHPDAEGNRLISKEVLAWIHRKKWK